jgi:hypothetical protein
LVVTTNKITSNAKKKKKCSQNSTTNKPSWIHRCSMEATHFKDVSASTKHPL